MIRRSVRFRLTACYSVILAVTFAVTGVGVWWAIRHSIYETVDNDLRSRLREMRSYLQKQAADTQPLAEALSKQEALGPLGNRFRIAGVDGHWVYQSAGTRNWEPKTLDVSHLRESARAKTISVRGKPMRVLTAPLPIGAIEIGADLHEYYEMLDGFTWTALLASPLLLLFASAGGYWMSRRALEPVDRITRAAEQIEARNLSERLPLRGANDELDRLSATLNSMLGRLEAAFDRITQFMTDASHELRTPVAIIRTTAEVSRSKPRTGAEYSKALDQILSESERTTKLIEDLMLLARADAGADAIVLQPLNFAECVRESCAEAGVLAQAANVRLEAGDFSECSVLGDDQALRRLLLILIDNAIKYTLAGGEVRVAMNVDGSSGKSMAVVEVRDNGVGISQEDLTRIFERFYRAAKDRSRKTGGVGLGLSIALWIAQRHAGQILVDSKPGQGSVFRVQLPVLLDRHTLSSSILQNTSAD